MLLDGIFGFEHELHSELRGFHWTVSCIVRSNEMVDFQSVFDVAVEKATILPQSDLDYVPFNFLCRNFDSLECTYLNLSMIYVTFEALDSRTLACEPRDPAGFPPVLLSPRFPRVDVCAAFEPCQLGLMDRNQLPPACSTR